PPPPPALRAFLRHITGGANAKSFQPMNINFGLFPPLSPDPGRHADRKPLMARRALADLDAWLRGTEPARCHRQVSFRGGAQRRARNPWTPAAGIWIPGPAFGRPGMTNVS